MPTLPLYATDVADPDASRRVTAPGGYEVWRFEAHDPKQQVRLVATLSEGCPWHPGYLRCYAWYRRFPTRCRPPVPRDCCCATFALVEQDKLTAQFFVQVYPDEFKSSQTEPSARVGANHFSRDKDGSLHLTLRGTPWAWTRYGPSLLGEQTVTASLVFKSLAETSGETASAFGDESAHRWIPVAPRCKVKGQIALYQSGQSSRVIEIATTGLHDHFFGTRPLAWDFRRQITGSILSDDESISMVILIPRDELCLPAARVVDATGTHTIEPTMLNWSRPRLWAPMIPRDIWLAELSLSAPRVIDVSPTNVRAIYQARRRNKTFEIACEMTELARLRWPGLGHLLELGISRV